MNRNRICIGISFALILIAILGACAGGGSSSNNDAVADNTGGGNTGGDTNSSLTGQQLADEILDRWLDVDFSNVNPDGVSDSDSDGSVDTNDAVSFIETLKALGFNVPQSTVHGIYNNYYTADGYGQTDDASLSDADKTGYIYTLENPISETELKAGDWSGLSIGDMIFVDYDMDFVWDMAAVYLGAYGEYDNAVVYASDYWDVVKIEDLDDTGSVIVIDINYGYCDVKSPAFDNIAAS